MPTSDVDLTQLLQTKLQGDWGLGRCGKRFECLVCQRLQGTPTLRNMRDLYLAGIDPNIVSVAYGLPVQNILDHSQRQKWPAQQREIGKTMLTSDVLVQLLLARLFASWKFASGSSADKALQMLLDVGGIGKKVNVEGQVRHSWEEMVAADDDSPEPPPIETTAHAVSVPAPSGPILLPAPGEHDPRERGH